MRKLIPYILILVMLLGNFAPAATVSAQATGLGTCTVTDTSERPYQVVHVEKNITYEQCQGFATGMLKVTFTPNDGSSTKVVKPASDESGSSELLKQLGAVCSIWSGSGWVGCSLYVFYAIFVTIPSFLLGFAAKFFNYMVSMTLSSSLYEAGFIAKTWKVVRDFGNIFFILVLLYAAFQTILGLGHGGAKKIIVSVIAMALVVNFSMFFTKVVVDAGNILALVFYNKIDVTQVKPEPDIGIQTNVEQKNIAGAFASRFNVNAFFSEQTFQELRDYGREYGVGNGVNNYVLFSMIVVYGIVIFTMVYALVVVGISLLGRTLMLMTLIIVSPFAFVSFAVPAFKKIDTVGFDSWIHKLLDSSFVAAVLMFILYLISQVLAANVFGSAVPGDGILGRMVLIFLPGMLIAMLLLKGASYAKKASGEFTGAVISGAKVTAGLVVGGTALGLAGLGRGTVGAFMKGASTGDTAANRLVQNRAILTNPNSRFSERLRARIDIAKGIAQQNTGIQGLQTRVGAFVNRDQVRVEGYAHARHTLDETSQNRYHKKFNDLTSIERNEVSDIIDRNIVSRQVYGNRAYNQLTNAEQQHVQFQVLMQRAPGGPGIHHGSAELIEQARGKQGIPSTIMQASRTGSYDVRGIANAVAKEYNTGFAKFATGMIAAVAMGMRGGLKSIGVQHGEPQKAFFKDLGNTITDALKGIKINVDVSKVGEVKKEDGHGHH